MTQSKPVFVTRAQYRHAHRMARTFNTLCTLGLAQAERGDVDVLNGMSRWMKAEYDSSMGRVWVDSRPGGGGYGAPIQALLSDKEFRAAWLPRYLSHFRMEPYFRKPCLLPR